MANTTTTKVNRLGLTHRQTVMIVLLLVGTFVTVLNQTVVAPALPSIMVDMSINAATGQWLTTGFTLVNAIMVPVTAFLIDRFPIRNLFLFSMSIFALGSLLAAWGPNFPVLLSGRIVQAAGAGVLMPMVMSVLMLTFPIERRGFAMGLFGIVMAFGPAIGPTAAGVVIDAADWHIMFYVVTAFAAIVALVTPFTMDRVPAKHAHARLDVPSVVLSTLGFGSLLYSFSIIGNGGFGIEFFVSLIVGLVVIVLFFRRQLSMEHPMLRVRVLANKTFLMGTIIGMVVQARSFPWVSCCLSICNRCLAILPPNLVSYSYPVRSSWASWARSQGAGSTATGRACSLLRARSCSRSARSCSPS